ncbi:MAG TPA: bifunctional serine/threonine-protein kinase/formylglycine-generating enzyme family protein [Steroidobacteraceae bacterium]|nr:bifunctional serine/threonine-protein kinase/formylglycine-generating enzyme family protein [Steroidobacteraceae bacterium]
MLAEIERQVTAEKIAPRLLLECLRLQQVAEPLPKDAYEAIYSVIVNWPQDPTVVTEAAQEPQSERRRTTAVGDLLQERFKLLSLIGAGGMSRVFKAVDLRRLEAGVADPYVAVKVLSKPFTEYFGSLAALQAEAHKLQSLSHPNIVRVNDCARDGEIVFMTMEYLAGESLQAKMRRSPNSRMDTATARAIVVAMANALAYAHRNHIVHGDLKPANVIITNDGEVKVIDFGMAKFVARKEEAGNGEASQPTKQPKAVTPRYASPEMLAGNDPQPADDVYALACLAYEILSGRLPFGARGAAGAIDPRSQLRRPPKMRKQHYLALRGALQFERRARTPTVRQFLQEFTGSPRAFLISGYAWAAIAALLLGAGTWAGLHLLHFKATGEPAAGAAAPTFIRDCPTCMLLRVLPAGRFMEGAAPGDALASPFERPQHPVVLGRPFAIAVNQTTVGEFREFAQATHRNMQGCTIYDGHWHYQADASWQAPGFAQTAAHPVTCVSWNDARAYAAWLSQKNGHTYRLPSAAQWEYAARAGVEAAQPWGANAAGACLVANVADRSAAQRFPSWQVFPCNDGYVNTAPVGSFAANAFGLHDMLGNVFEWVEDCWRNNYAGAPADGSASMSGDCTQHELRGGSWYTAPQYVRLSYRNRFPADYRSSSVGFRLLRDLSRR